MTDELLTIRDGVRMLHESLADMTKCLLLEGKSDERASLADIMTRYGIDLVNSDDPDQAVDYCREHAPEMVMVPDKPEKMAASEIIKRLRAAAGDHKPVVLVYSDGKDPRRISEAIWEGASDCVMTPFDAGTVDQKLHQLGVV